MTSFLLAPQAIDIASPGHLVRSHRILGFASARIEIAGLRPKAIAPAASTDAIPKGASPLAAGGACLAGLTNHQGRGSVPGATPFGGWSARGARWRPVDHLILASLNSTCLRATGSYFCISSLLVWARAFFFVT